jgi:hypothetical protein
MNPSVDRVPFPELARRNPIDLATIEREIFAVSLDNGKLVPRGAAQHGWKTSRGARDAPRVPGPAAPYSDGCRSRSVFPGTNR